MKDSEPVARGDFERECEYRIVVRGRIDESWSERLAGMRITAGEFCDGVPTSRLFGRLRDQAQLSGVLNCLCDLRYFILLVEFVDEVRNHRRNGPQCRDG